MIQYLFAIYFVMKNFLSYLLLAGIVGFLTILPIKHAAAATEPTVDELISLILASESSTWTVTQPTTTTQPTQVTTEQPTTTTTATEQPATVAPTTTTSSSSIANDQEFQSALAWMYANGLTQYATVDAYAPNDGLTRQQAAKFFVVFAQTIIWKSAPTTNTTACSFTDSGFDATLKPYVMQACEYGIMVWKDGVFRPNDEISRSEFTTALVRMISGKKLDETTTPWWLAYYVQARDRWLTKEQNANAYDGDLTRYAAALLLYRWVGIVKNTTETPVVQTPTTTWSTTELTTSTTGTTTVTTGAMPDIPMVTSLTSDPALQEAIYWLHDIGVTRYTDINDYRPFDPISRQEAAKMYVTFRYALGIQTTASVAEAQCQFTDLINADQTLVPYIQQACSIGILKWSSGLFLPFDNLTRAQAITILLRITDGYQDESGAIWWQKYYDRAVQLGMISPMSAENFQKPISRYEIAMLLYKSKVQRDIVLNLNNDFETNKFIFTISPTGVSTTGNLTGLVSINTHLLESNPNGTYVVDLFGMQYKIVKTVTQKYLNNDFVWYGKMLLLDETKEIGTVALTISNGVVIAWTLRPYEIADVTYTISPSSQQPYYTLVRKVAN